jgi:hypothetical protein
MWDSTVLDAFTKKYAGDYLYTTMVRHQGTVIALAMDRQQQISYTVLDLNAAGDGDSPDNTSSPNPLDVTYWQASPRPLNFPNEIASVGYGVTDQTLFPVVRNGRFIPEKPGTRLRPDEINAFLSTTARLTADAPFHALSDGQFVYVFRQAIANPAHYPDTATQTAARKKMTFVDPEGHVITSADGSEAKLGFTDKTGTFQTVSADTVSPLVNATLLIDRFVLAGSQLQPKMEVRFQRSRSKTRPQSRKDSLGAKDLDGNPFLEPTQQLKFVGNLTGGRFTVLLVPTAVQEIQRWHIFTHNSKTGLIDSFDVERSPDGLFNTRGSQVYTCVDHPEVFAQKPGTCVEPRLGDPSQLCDQDLVPRVVIEGYAESALRPKNSEEMDAEVEIELDRIGQADLQSQGSFSVVSEPFIALGKGVKLGNVFTQEAWISPIASSTAPQALITGHGDKTVDSLEASRADHATCPSVWIEAGSRIRVGFGTGSQWNECATRSLLTPNRWNHLAITFDGNAFRFYVDGKLREKIDQVSVYINSTLQTDANDPDPVKPKLEPIANTQRPDIPITFIGASQNSFNGTIDEIRLWSRVRSPQELQASLNQRLVGQETGLVGYWRFDEAVGDTVYDQTDNSIHGTLHGTVEWSVTPDSAPPVTLMLNGWQWIASDAPVGESLGVSRNSFQLASETSAGAIALRTVESGLTALLYYQQENVTSGYAAEEKPLKRHARVMLAVATKSERGDKNEIATLDFAVSVSGKLAQVPDVIPLSVIHAPDATGQSINQQLDKASGLQGQIRVLQQGITHLQRQMDALAPVIDILNAAIANPNRISPAITDPDLAYLNDQLAQLRVLAESRDNKQRVLDFLLSRIANAEVTFYQNYDFDGPFLTLKTRVVDAIDLDRHRLNRQISSFRIPPLLQVKVFDAPSFTGNSALFKSDVPRLDNVWNDKIASLEITDNPDYTQTERDNLTKAQQDEEAAKEGLRTEQSKLQERMQAYWGEFRAKHIQLTTAQTELDALQSVLESGVEVSMHLVHTDPFGLTISGGLLGFAWTQDTPLLFDSATGSLALYFRGTDDQFFVAYYKTLTERAQYPLMDQNGQARVVCKARSTDPEMDQLAIAITRSTAAETCTVTITGAGIEEIWTQMPRTPEKFVKVLNGLAGDREYVGAGTLVSDLGQVRRLHMPAGVQRSLAVGDTLFVGKTKVVVKEAVSRGATEWAIASSELSVPATQLPIFFIEYDYATNAETTKVPNDLYNGSLLMRAEVQGAIDATSMVQIGQRVTSGATLSCKWTAAAPGSTLIFDGIDDVASLSNPALLKQFAAPKDVTLEAWVRPSRSGESARLIQYYQSEDSNYTLGLERKELRSALELDGNTFVDLDRGVVIGNQFTQEVWIYPTPSDDNIRGILGNYSDNDRRRSPSIWVDRQTHIRAGFGDGQNFLTFNTYRDENSPPVLTSNTWNHVAVTMDGTAYSLYVNGIFKQRWSVPAGRVPVSSPIQLIGKVPVRVAGRVENHFFEGCIDDVRLWKRVRTQTEIQADMNRQLGGNETDLVGYWHFETEIARDYSRYGNDGRIMGTLTLAASPLPAYSIFAGVNNQFVQTQDLFSVGNWNHLAATFRQSYALEFDGTGGYLDCGNDSTLDISRDLTIEVFLQVHDFSRGNSILSRGRFDDGTTDHDVPYMLFLHADGRIGFAFEDIKHKSHLFVSTGTIDRQFCKIAVTRQRKKTETPKKDTDGNVIGAKVNAWDEITFYINGNAVGFARYESKQSASDDFRQPVDVGNSSQALEIGKSRQIGQFIAPFRGTISEARIWNIACDPNTLARDIRGTEKGLVSWWRFEENDGNTAFDSKSRNHATINGAVKWVKDPNPEGPKLILYRNGAPVTTELASAGTLSVREPQFTLAACRHNTGLQEYLQGELEELRIWKTARTQEQIQDNLFRRLLGEQDDLIAYYTFDLDSDQARQTLTTLYDHSPQGNDLTITGATYILSTAPISGDAPEVRSALAGVRTTFHGLIQSQPGVQEYGDLQYDIDGNLIGVFKRCYSFIRGAEWRLLTSFKVGDLVTEWIGQMQTAPQLIGYIEGAPPVPSENLTGTGYVQGEFADYTGASSVELSQAESTTYTYSASKDKGFDMSVEGALKVGGKSKSLTGAGIGGFVASTVEESEMAVGWKATFENSLSWLEDASTGVGRTTTGKTRMELRGMVENDDAVAYPKMGRRFVPDNLGMALVKSETADIFALRLKHNQALVSFQMRPNPDIPPDRNIITFPINPRYTRQGTLDGKIGFEVDSNYPNALTYSPDSSYFKPIEAYGIKNRIDREEANLQTYYEQYKAGAKGRRQDGLYGNSKDLAVGRALEKLPHLNKRNLVNTYVWTAAGGLFAETQETMDVYSETLGGAYAFKGMGGPTIELDLAVMKSRVMLELEALFGGHLNLTVTKSQESERAFSLDVGLDQVESDIYLRDENGNLIMDKSGQPDPNDPTGIRHWTPKLMPGRVDAYRFMTFYLEPKSDHFDLFFNRVVDPIWLEQSDDPSAVALREARQKPNNCWRIMHRITYVSRILPPFSEPAPSSLEKTLQTLDIDSNYELIKQLEPFVSDRLTSYPEFTSAIRETIKLYLPALQPHTPEIIRYMSLYFGLGDAQALMEPDAEEIDVPRTINQPPIVNAGVNQILGLDGPTVTATLDGTAIDDRISRANALFSTWELISGEGAVEFDNPHSLKVNATFTKRGKYVLRLTVDDGSLSASDTVTIVVNQRPVISAGDNQQVQPQTDPGQPDPGQAGPKLIAQLSGSIIDSGLGDPTYGGMTVKWTQQSRFGQVTFSDDKALPPEVQFDQIGTYLLKLTVDNGSFTADSEILIAVAARVTDQLQVLYAFEAQSGAIAPDVSGVGTPLDPLDLTIHSPSNTRWIQGGLVLHAPTALATAGAATRIIQAVKASNEVTLEVWMKPTVPNHTGLARILTLSDGSGKRNITLGQSGNRYYVAIRTTTTSANASTKAFMAGTVKTEGLTHLVCTRTAAGRVHLYLDGKDVGHRDVSGALSVWDESFKLALGNELGNNAGGDRAWLGEYHLIAIYSRALTPKDIQQNFEFGANTNLPPVISAGPDQTINWPEAQPLPIRAELQGRATHDRNPQPTTISWIQVAGPRTPNGVDLSDERALRTDATFTQNGYYVLRLTVDDGELMASDEVAITVNQPPTFTAQADAHVALTKTSVSALLKGRIQNTGLGDPDARAISTWRRMSGPGTVQIDAPDRLETQATFTGRGVYGLELEVQNGLFTKKTPVTITVHQTPSVKAGEPQIVTLPAENPTAPVQVSLTGEILDSGSPQPNVLNFRWEQVNGPSLVVFADAQSRSTTATFTVGGLYELRLTATNREIPDLVSSAEVVITVNQYPTVYAGIDQTIQLPVDLELDAIVSDDGLPVVPGILTLNWERVSGLGQVIFGDRHSSHTTAKFSQGGTYVLRLVANDGVVQASDSLTVVAKAAPRVSRELLALYTFEENGGTIIRDRSGVTPALDLSFTTGAALANGVLTVSNPTIVTSPGPATKLVSRAKAKPRNEHAITLEAWVRPSHANPPQNVSTRIVTLSLDQQRRNFTLWQQSEGRYAVLLRTTSTDLNGINNAFPAGTVRTDRVSHLVYTWSATTGIARFYQDGVEVGQRTGISGDFSVWEETYRLGLANEFGNNPLRAWLGELHLVAFYNTALTLDEIRQNFAAGSNAT